MGGAKVDGLPHSLALFEGIYQLELYALGAVLGVEAAAIAQRKGSEHIAVGACGQHTEIVLGRHAVTALADVHAVQAGRGHRHVELVVHFKEDADLVAVLGGIVDVLHLHGLASLDGFQRIHMELDAAHADAFAFDPAGAAEIGKV